ncbi:MAG TPA: tRNA pseudouridine(38-40) synthase TruA, partial [Gammaproteobacteria bacterium]|nr:tRNA pseudouridine(38-40) synthase TruA [Gammaproteobacteria bacterium]
MRIALGVEYIGTNYSGWQSHPQQPHVPSVQGAVEAALSFVANHPVSITCAGRTDAGVHACGQVVHCDVEVVRTPHAWVFGCNTKLPPDIRVLWMQEVPVDFSARRSATGRHYKYVIYNNKIRPSLLHNYVGWHYGALDEQLMQTAAQSWLGEHDFSSFRGSGCQSISPVRNVKMITIERRGDMVIIDIMADAFLYHMVRNMVGALLEIGSGKRSTGWAKQVLLARCRTKAGITAPPQGLYLTHVIYPEQLQLP